MNLYHQVLASPGFLCVCILVTLSGCAANKESVLMNQHELPAINLCVVPNPSVPSSAFNRYQSAAKKHSGYWVNYQCKEPCEDWRQCLVPAYSDDNGSLLGNGRNPEQSKMALAFVVDGMAGHIAMSDDGEKTVFIHTGAGGTRYYSKPAATLEQNSSARTVMMRWEKGYVSPIVQDPFLQPIAWGWYTRTSEKPTNIKELNKRVASVIAWTHDNLSADAMFATLGCSMGTNATFGPVLWHGLDPIIDYQLFVGGPNMWDLNAQCKRRHYDKGYCAVDGVTTCSNDSDCQGLAAYSRCAIPGEYTTIDLTFEQLPNHMHDTDACDIRAADRSTIAFAPFDDSSMGFASGADWQIDHHMDFLVNLGAKQGKGYSELGGDEYWGLGHFPMVYKQIKPAKNRDWKSIPASHHCDAMYDEALELIKERMGL